MSSSSHSPWLLVKMALDGNAHGFPITIEAGAWHFELNL